MDSQNSDKCKKSHVECCMTVRRSLFEGDSIKGLTITKTVDLNGTEFAEIRKLIAYFINYEIKSINGSV